MSQLCLALLYICGLTIPKQSMCARGGNLVDGGNPACPQNFQLMPTLENVALWVTDQHRQHNEARLLPHRGQPGVAWEAPVPFRRLSNFRRPFWKEDAGIS